MGVTQSKTTLCKLETPKGTLKGLELSDLTSKPVYQRYTRIPYAQPPIGPLRWRRPQQLSPDFTFSKSGTEPGDYTAFGPICPQPEYGHSAAKLEGPDAAPPIENVQSEDCLYLNIWRPCGQPPKDGWPVQIYIHGGWLQVGDAAQDHTEDPFDLLATTNHPRIIIAPTYRLNLFGFLTGSRVEEVGEDEAPGNYGFWDQRMAIEWTASNIAMFGGNPDKITLGGLSAGANSTFFQLYHDTYLPREQRLIKRIYLWSNAVGIQPNATGAEITNKQFDELCSALNIKASLPAKERLQKLREIPADTLVSVIPKLALHTFRASTDNSFIPPTFLSSIHDGSFTTALAANGISIILGEVAHESRLYRLVNPPSTFSSLKTQLSNYYPVSVVSALMKHYTLPSQETGTADEWADTYAKIVADCQVHAVIRGLTSSLLSPPARAIALPISKVHRYRISWRARSLDSWIEPAVGVCHGADGPIWWMSGLRAGYTNEDKEKALRFLEPFGKFLYGERDIGWGNGEMNEQSVRCLDADGNVSVEVDGERRWKTGLEVWKCLWDAQKGDHA